MKTVLIKNAKYNLKFNYYANEDGSIYSEKSKKTLSWQKDKDGYAKVLLMSDDGKRHRYSVHRLILENFKPVENMDKMQVNHIDGNKWNNKLSNLEWATCSENNKHAHKIGLKSQKGEKNNATKLTEELVKLIILMLLEKKYTQKQIGLKFGVSEDVIGAIKNKRNWKHLTEHINFY